MAMVGYRTESIYQRYKVADEAMLKESAAKLAALHESEKSPPGSGGCRFSRSWGPSEQKS